MIFDFNYAFSILPALFEATITTVQIALLGYVGAIIIGLFLATARMASIPPLAIFALTIIEFIRNTPLLVQLFLFVYGLPQLGLSLPVLPTAIGVLALHYGTYCAEVYRGGLQAVAKTQWDAAAVLGFTPAKTLFFVILPQVFPVIVPGLANYAISILKSTPYLSVVAVMELLHRAKLIGAEDFRYLEPFTIVGVIFLIISLVASFLLRRLEAYSRARYNSTNW